MGEVGDDDWLDIEPAVKAGCVLPDVQIRLSIMRGSKASAFVTCRGVARDWVTANLPRFRAQIGGPDADRVRIIADAVSGRFEATECRGGTLRLNLGHITAWPNEVRAPVACNFKIDSVVNALVFTVPVTFVRRTPVRVEAPPAPRIIDRRPVGVVSMGEPAPGRSALDQRKALR